MRFRIALTLAAALALPRPAAAEEVIRIAVAERVVAPVVVEGRGLRARSLTEEASYAEMDGGRATLARRGDALLLEAREAGAEAVKLRADGPIAVAGKVLRGAVEVLLDERGGMLVVNELPIEDYLAAVLGSEMPPSFPVEALKAQAVAARTYAVRKKLEAEGRAFHLGATVLSQVYGGVHREDARTRAAVEATAGEVLVHEHEPIEAYFFSSCGGTTAEGGEALGRELPYLTSHDCPERASVPGARWTIELGARELGRRLGTGPVERLAVTGRTASGRVRGVEVRSRNGARRLAGADLRRRMGYGELKSLDFEVRRDGTAFRFTGQGSGHGAGLCQWGARGAAEDGAAYARILELYYPETALRRMY